MGLMRQKKVSEEQKPPLSAVSSVLAARLVGDSYNHPGEMLLLN